MNYIYDILVNFNEQYYDFFEWNLNDEIIHVRKMPLIKVESNILKEIIYHNIKTGSDFLDTIKNKTEIFNNRDIKIMTYACLFSDCEKVCAAMFDHDGYLKYRSDLLVDEAFEVIETIDKSENFQFNYEIINKNYYSELKTRHEKQLEDFLIKEIDRLNEDNEIEKLKYLYYECFSLKEKNKDKIINKLKKEIINSWDIMYPKIYNFFKISSQIN